MVLFHVFIFFVQRFFPRFRVFHKFSHKAQAVCKVETVAEAFVGNKAKAPMLFLHNLAVFHHRYTFFLAHGKEKPRCAKVVCMVEDMAYAKAFKVGNKE